MNDVLEESEQQPDLDTPTNDLMDQVRVIMESFERGQITSEQVDLQLRHVVEQVVNGTVAMGRGIGQEQQGDSSAAGVTRTRDDAVEEGGVLPKRRREEGAGR